MRALVLVPILLATPALAGCVFDDEPALAIPEIAESLIPAATGGVRYLPVRTFEPTLGITSDGAIFMTGGNTTAGIAHQTLFRSTDQGLTWDDVTPSIAGVTNYPPNSNDPYVYVDEDTDRVFDFEMQGLSCNMLAYSDDGGNSWVPSPLGCTPTQGFQDHQTIFSGANRLLPIDPIAYEKVVYYCVNRVLDSACASSLDGGMTWGPMRPLVYDGFDEDINLASVVDDPLDLVCSGLHAHGAAASNGIIFLPRIDCGTPTVAWSADHGLNWQRSTIPSPVTGSGHELAIALDEADNLYAIFKGVDARMYFSMSDDLGRTWTEAIDVTPANVTLTDFPTIDAGADGRVALAFVGVAAEEGLGYADLDLSHHWNAYIVTGVDLWNETATWEATRVNPEDDPIARGQCGGSRCTVRGGGLGDFIDIQIDPAGRPWAAFADVCHQKCIETDANATRARFVRDLSLGFVGTLATGPSLFGELVPLPPLLGDEAATLLDAQEGS